MRPFFSSFSLLLFSSLFFFNQVFAESSSEYVEKIHEDIVFVVRAKQGIYEENPEEFIKAISLALQPLVDFKRISRNVMGKHYKDANKEQIEKFNKVFKASLLDTYSKTLAEFKDEEILVSSNVKKSPKGNREKVSLQIVTATKIYPAVYDMYLNKKGHWKLINIVINGVNLGLTFRNQFYSLMEKEGNNLDLVIEKWVTSI